MKHCGPFNPLPARTEVTAVLPTQEEILADRMAALTAADIPPDDDGAGWEDDGTGRPAELAALDGNAWEELLAAAVPVITGLPGRTVLAGGSARPGGGRVPGRVRAPRPQRRRDRVRGRRGAGCAGGGAGAG